MKEREEEEEPDDIDPRLSIARMMKAVESGRCVVCGIPLDLRHGEAPRIACEDCDETREK